jgi:hypothetical protein
MSLSGTKASPTIILFSESIVLNSTLCLLNATKFSSIAGDSTKDIPQL